MPAAWPLSFLDPIFPVSRVLKLSTHSKALEELSNEGELKEPVASQVQPSSSPEVKRSKFAENPPV
jgi:hypothetical protein